MDLRLFEVLGKYGGLGGLSIGLVLIVIVTAIGKATPRRSSDNAKFFSLLHNAMYVAFVIGVLGIGAWTVVAVSSKRRPSNPAQQQTNTVTQKSTGPGSPNIQGVQGPVTITEDQSGGEPHTKAQSQQKAAKTTK